MTKRTRTFVLAASTVLVVGVGTAAVASYVGFDKLAILGRQSAHELSFVPQEAELVAYVDVRQLINSDVRQRLLPEFTDHASHDRLLEQTGINLQTDVASVYMALLPRAESASTADAAPGGKPGQPVMLARGRFDRARIEALILERGGVANTYQGVWVLTSEAPDISVAFVETDLVAAGPTESVRTLLDTRAARSGSVREHDEFMRLIGRVDGSSAWTVGRFESMHGALPVPSVSLSQLPAISWFAASGQVDSGVAATIHAEARDAEAARDLGEVVRGFVALARMQAAHQPAFAQLIESIQLSTQGTTVTVDFSVPPQLIEVLSTMRPRVPAASTPPAPGATPRRALVPPSI